MNATTDPILGWYIPARGKPRWVLAATSTHVLYGNGGSSHRECSIKTFKRWMKKSKAEKRSDQ